MHTAHVRVVLALVLLTSAGLFPMQVEGSAPPPLRIADQIVVYTVNSVADPGNGTCDAVECTLREALTAIQGLDPNPTRSILFDIPGPGPHTIRPLSPLPRGWGHLIIDGYSQPGAHPNTAPLGEAIDVRILIELDGSLAGPGADGIRFWSAYAARVQGLAINRFDGYGVTVEGEEHRIVGNFIGTDTTGIVALGNGQGGIRTFDPGMVIYVGGASPAERNLVSGNLGDGIFVNGPGLGTVVSGTYIGTDVSGTAPLPNLGAGIRARGVKGTYSDNIITTNAGGGLVVEDNLAFLSGGLITGNHAERGGGVHIKSGYVEIVGSRIEGNQAQVGGGIYIEAGTMQVTDSAIRDNLSLGDIAVLHGSGGGIHNAAGTLTVLRTQISGNRAVSPGTSAGGGIYNGGTLTVMASTLHANQVSGMASYYGAGVHNAGQATLEGVTIDGNVAEGRYLGRGGGIYNSGSMAMTNCTVSGNRTDSHSSGGGIFSDGALTLMNCTVADNQAGFGGGIHGQAALKNTVVANNYTGRPMDANCSAAVGSQGHNLASDDSCHFAAVGDLNNADARLGVLQDNGGPTWTQALLPGSLAVDAGDDNGCPPTDQRGATFTRLRDGDGDGAAACDIGAFEVQAAPSVKARLTLRVDARPDRPRNFQVWGAFGRVRLDDPGSDDGDPYAQAVTYLVDAGTYNFALAVPYRWFLADIHCNRQAGVQVDRAQARVQLQPQAGEEFDCTYVVDYSGTVLVRSYLDKNGNGVREAGERWMSGWWGELYDADGTIVASNFTNSVGKWNIYDLRPGQYTLCQKPQSGWSNTQPAVFAADHQGWPCYNFDLQPDQAILTYFGYTDQALSAASGNAQAAMFGLRHSDGAADRLQDEMYTEETFVDLDAAVADDPGSPDPATIIYLPYAGR